MKKTTLTAILLSTALCMALTGCASEIQPVNTSSDSSAVQTNASETETSQTEGTQSTETTETTDMLRGGGGFAPNGDFGNMAGFGDATSSASNAISSDTVITVTKGSSALDTSDIFSDRDSSQTADLSDAKTITVSDGNTIEITEEGVYIITGTAQNCTIKVDAGKSDKVQLVLDGVSITNENFPAIYIVSADKCFITTTDSTNNLSVTSSFNSDGDTNTDAVIFSKDDIVFNGVGTLNITCATVNGIACKDGIKLTGGTYSITSANDSIEAKDFIAVSGGSFTVNSKKDAIHCEDDEDGSVGWIYISGGEFDITASDDGIQATTILQIDGGTFDIEAAEGLEGTYVQINGGNISISASDDGINASYKTTAISIPAVEFNGGETTIVMAQGDTDAVDANGNIYVNDGTITITGVSSFDYDGTGELNGGTVTVNGQKLTSMPNQMMGGGGKGGWGGDAAFGGQSDQNGFGGQNDQNGFGRGGQGGFGGRGGFGTRM